MEKNKEDLTPQEREKVENVMRGFNAKILENIRKRDEQQISKAATKVEPKNTPKP